MVERAPVGEEQTHPVTAYLERIGCPQIGIEDISLPTKEEKAYLGEYLDLRKEWRKQCFVAAEAEQQYYELTGKHSYPATQPRHMFRSSEVWDVNYGTTKAGQAARDSFLAMKGNGHELAQKLIAKRPKKFTAEQQYVWHAVLADSFPLNNANLNPVEFAYTAFGYLEAARENLDQPLLVIRSRRQKSSDLILASSSRLEFGEKSIDLVVQNGIRVVFEKQVHEHYGGRSGMIGSGHWEWVWHSINEKNRDERTERFDELAVAQLVSPGANPSKAKTRFAALSQLAGSDPETFIEHLVYRPPSSSRSLLEIEEEPPKLAILTGSDIDTALTMIREQAPEQLRWKEFYGALKAGIKCLFEQRQIDQHAKLMEKVGEVAVDPLDFYEAPKKA